jgi:hypothetical protein
MVLQANEANKALIDKYGYSKSDVLSMDLREKTKELKKLGYVWEKRNNHGCA